MDLPDLSVRRTRATSMQRKARRPLRRRGDRVERASVFLQRVDPAVAGQHGDLRTFRVCCRIVRGFGLSDDEALDVLG